MKKLLGLWLIVCSLLFLAGCGSTQPVVEDTEETSTDIQTSTSDLSTNEKCIELMAYSLKWAEYQQKWDMDTFMAWAKKVEALVETYDMTESDCNWAVMDPDFMKKVQKRVGELK